MTRVPPMPCFRASPSLVVLCLLLIFVLEMRTLLGWLDANVLPNGFQNEIFHLGNALELTIALREGGWVTAHNILFEQYWPPLLYVVSLPFNVLSLSRDHFVYANLVFLALLIASTYGLGRALEGRGAGLLSVAFLVLFPSIAGNLRHFEPNVALTAMVTSSLWLLHHSHQFRRRGMALGFGVWVGLTLLTDRITGAFFLVLPVVWVMARAWVGKDRAAFPARGMSLMHLGIAVLGALLVSGYYYEHFFRLHLSEVLGQAMTGEILDTGERSEIRDPFSLGSLFFYPLTLLDAQVGFLPGLLLCGLAGLALLYRERKDGLLHAWLLGGLIVFTIIQKKQIYYTIPILPAFSLLAGIGSSRAWSRGIRTWKNWTLKAAVILALVLLWHQHEAQSGGEWVLPPRVRIPLADRYLELALLHGRSPLPDAWVAPRYVQAAPPDQEDYQLQEMVEDMGTWWGVHRDFRINLFSEDPTLFEGYIVFLVRCAFPDAKVNGLTQSPDGFYENVRLMNLFLYISSGLRTWPSSQTVEDALEGARFRPRRARPPLASALSEQRDRMEHITSRQTSTGVGLHLFGGRAGDEGGSR